MEFGFKKPLVKVKIRNFEPLTDNNNPMTRKAILKDKIKEKVNLEKAKKTVKTNYSLSRLLII